MSKDALKATEKGIEETGQRLGMLHIEKIEYPPVEMLENALMKKEQELSQYMQEKSRLEERKMQAERK